MPGCHLGDAGPLATAAMSDERTAAWRLCREPDEADSRAGGRPLNSEGGFIASPGEEGGTGGSPGPPKPSEKSHNYDPNTSRGLRFKVRLILTGSAGVGLYANPQPSANARRQGGRQNRHAAPASEK